MKTALVLGAGGFIGSHMVRRLKREGFWVRGVDLKYPEYSKTEANEFIKGDLRDESLVSKILKTPEKNSFDHTTTQMALLKFSIKINLLLSYVVSIFETFQSSHLLLATDQDQNRI